MSYWSSDVCSSDLSGILRQAQFPGDQRVRRGDVRHVRWRRGDDAGAVQRENPAQSAIAVADVDQTGACHDLQRPARRQGQSALPRPPGQPHRPLDAQMPAGADRQYAAARQIRSDEHTSELQSLMRISYAVFCLKKKTHTKTTTYHQN